MNIIAAIVKNNELGKNNDLLWKLPNDLKFFKEKTLNKTIIMGYNTFVSLGRVLPNRKHVVLCFDDVELPNEVILVKSLKEALEYMTEDAFIVGGASIYKQFIDKVNNLYLTEVEDTCDADVYFPLFDKEKYNKTILGSNEDNGIKYNHVLYEKK